MASSINLKYKNYLPKEETFQEPAKKKIGLFIIILFLLSGCPNSFNMKDALYLELALFELTQPEGLSMASWLQLMEAVGCLAFFCMLCIDTQMLWPKKYLLYIFSILTLLMSLTLAFSWSISIEGFSLFIMLGMTVGELVGWVQYILVIPWIIRNYNARILSPFIAGNGLMIWVLVTLEVIQQPGGLLRFSPMIYFLIAAIMYAGTLGVCIYTFESGFEKLTSEDDLQTLEPWQKNLWLQLFPKGWQKTKKYIFIRIWGEGITWSLVPITLPYAAKNSVTTDDGEAYLQWAISIGLLSMLIGYLSSYLATERFWIFESLVAATIADGIILLAAANIGTWTTWPMQVLLMLSVAVSKMAFAWSIPLIFRDIERKFPENSEVLVRLNSLWALIASVLIKTTMWLFTTGMIS